VQAQWAGGLDRLQRGEICDERHDPPAEKVIARAPRLTRQQDQDRIRQEFIADGGVGRNRRPRPPVVLITDRIQACRKD
jgi:hypothetical protein